MIKIITGQIRNPISYPLMVIAADIIDYTVLQIHNWLSSRAKVPSLKHESNNAQIKMAFSI